MNLFTEKHWRHRHREQIYGHDWVGRKEKVGVYGEGNMETYITYCKIKWEFSL